jgi:uncharacterized membrane protein
MHVCLFIRSATTGFLPISSPAAQHLLLLMVLVLEVTTMSTIEKSIELNVPASTAYNQWTQFEDFPHFMEGVEQVRQIGDKHLHWRVNVGGKKKEFETEITEQIPDKRIAWQTRGGTENAGVVTFHRLNERMSRIMVQMEYDPQGFVEKAGDLLGVASRRVQGDLERFKKYVEARGTESGAWRGTIPESADGRAK